MDVLIYQPENLPYLLSSKVRASKTHTVLLGYWKEKNNCKFNFVLTPFLEFSVLSFSFIWIHFLWKKCTSYRLAYMVINIHSKRQLAISKVTLKSYFSLDMLFDMNFVFLCFFWRGFFWKNLNRYHRIIQVCDILCQQKKKEFFHEQINIPLWICTNI